MKFGPSFTVGTKTPKKRDGEPAGFLISLKVSRKFFVGSLFIDILLVRISESFSDHL